MTDPARAHILPDPATDLGRVIRRRLAEEEISWLVSVTSAGDADQAEQRAGF